MQLPSVAEDMQVLTAPKVIACKRRRGSFLIPGSNPPVAVHLGQRPSEHVRRGDLVLSFGGGIQVGDASIAVDSNHGIADLAQDEGLKLELETLRISRRPLFCR